ncbi:caspase domain-containing protein [Rhizobium ruizarguesonis]|nr:caspase family protein [Rhizobium rhizogenes]
MRIVIAVGCDTYEKPPLETLSGAENDAKEVFNHLVADGFGESSTKDSRLLLSPSMDDLRSAVATVLFSGDPIEELTFFFAGHGGVKDGTYFLCLRDTDVDRMSVNALSITQLFAWITEAKIGHTNIIIDACQSGGVVHDIGVLLNPSVIGKTGSMAVSILAASSSNESAGESDGAGHCTSALMNCLKGTSIVQTTRPSLDLVEVGQVVSRAMQGNRQTPVCWGINLFGVSRLAKNPRFSGDLDTIPETFPGLAADAAGNEHIRAASDAIWAQYLALSNEFDADRFLDVIQPVCRRLHDEPATAAAFVMGLSATFGVRAETLDSFEVSRVHAACAVALLPLATSDPLCGSAIEQLASRVVDAVALGMEDLAVELDRENYHLLISGAGAADYYFLPLRVMSILGWIGAAAQLAGFAGQAAAERMAPARDLVRVICSHYCNSIVPVSDEIAPFYVAFASAAEALGCGDELETVSCLLLRKLHDRGGHLAAPGLNGEEAFLFLNASAMGRYEDCRKLIANPTGLLPAILLVLKQIGLSEQAEGAMRGFDHTNINFFVPDNFGDFGARVIEDGTNVTLNIGHSIFTIDDVSKEWEAIADGLRSNIALASTSVRGASLLASLLRPDRIPWFLIAGQQAAEATSINDAVEA